MDNYKNKSKTSSISPLKHKINLKTELKQIDDNYCNTVKKLKNSISSSNNKTNKNLYSSKSKKFTPLGLFKNFLTSNNGSTNEDQNFQFKNSLFQSNYKIFFDLKNNLGYPFKRKSIPTFYADKMLENIKKRNKETSSTNASLSENSYSCFAKEALKTKNDEKKILNLKNENISKKAKILDFNGLESKINENNAKIDKFDSSNFLGRSNSIKNTLPFFSREMCNTQGNSTSSKISVNSKEEYLYKKIFYNNKHKIKANNYLIDNKLNLIYAENEKQYIDIITKSRINIKKRKKLKNLKLLNSMNKEMKELNDKSRFIKKVIDYTFPEMVIGRIKEEKKIAKKSRNKNIKIIDCKSVKKEKDVKEKTYTDYLLKSFTVKKQEFKNKYN